MPCNRSQVVAAGFAIQVFTPPPQPCMSLHGVERQVPRVTPFPIAGFGILLSPFTIVFGEGHQRPGRDEAELRQFLPFAAARPWVRDPSFGDGDTKLSRHGRINQRVTPLLMR